MNEQLTDKEKAILKNLVDPDKETEHYYDWPEQFTQSVLAGLMTDPYLFTQCKHLIKPHYFPDKAHEKICHIILKYHDDYNKLPDKKIIETELYEQLGDIPSRHYYFAELDIIAQSYEVSLEKREYILDKITSFGKTQALRGAFKKSLDLLFNKGNNLDKWDRIKTFLTDALAVERNIDLGLDYFATLEERYERIEKQIAEKDFFSSGMPSIDAALGGGLSRKEIGSWAGMSGSGKSLALAKGAYVNLISERNVAYISLEMDEDKTANRFDALMSQVPIGALTQEKEEVFKYIKDFTKHRPNKFYIKQFPAGSADISTLKAYLSQLAMHGFKPDLLLVDYVGELRDAPGMKTYESRQRLVRDLRSLAVEQNICILTAMQIGRSGREAMAAGFIDDQHLADSQGQIRPLDCLWSINQNEIEQKAGVGKIYVVKHRNGKSRFTIYFERNPYTLDMKEISSETYRAKLNLVKEEVCENVMSELDSKTKFSSNKNTNKKSKF